MVEVENHCSGQKYVVGRRNDGLAPLCLSTLFGLMSENVETENKMLCQKYMK